MPAQTPVVIGHRGASGYRPEHTLASYELAARQGADYIEPDLVSTRDGVLVARHENEISTTTDVADHPELAHLRRTRLVDGVEVTGWFTEDLTLDQLRTLRAVERLGDLRPANREHDGRHQVPTFAEILALRARLSLELGRPVGVYPETKHPSHFRALGIPLEEPLVDELRGAGLDSESAPVYLQSFELGALVRMRQKLGCRAPQILLLESWDVLPHDLRAPAGRAVLPGLDGVSASVPDLVGPAGLAVLAPVVDGLGPAKTMVLPWGADGALGDPTPLVRHAHAHGLRVHPWTFRAENAFLPPALRLGEDPAGHGRIGEEVVAHLEAGVDGVFTDHPDLVAAALRGTR